MRWSTLSAHLLEDRQKQFAFAPEVVINAADDGARAGHRVGHRCRGEATSREYLDRCVEDSPLDGAGLGPAVGPRGGRHTVRR